MCHDVTANVLIKQSATEEMNDIIAKATSLIPRQFWKNAMPKKDPIKEINVLAPEYKLYSFIAQ